jgi:hypothetical protein
VTDEERPATGAPSPGLAWSPPEAPPAVPGPSPAAPGAGWGPVAPPLIPSRLSPPLGSSPPGGLPLGGSPYGAPPPGGVPLLDRSPQRGGGRRAALVVACVVALLAGLAVAVRLPGPLSPLASHAGFTGSARSPSAGSASAHNGAIGYQAFDDGARQLLAQMTSALAAHDVTRFASVASPGSASMRARLRQMYGALVALQPAAFTFEVDPARTARGLSSPRPEAHTLPVRVTYSLKRWDVTDVRVPLTFVATRSPGGGWGLAEDRTTTDADSDDRLEPWVLDNTYVTRTRHVLVIGDRSHQAQARRLAATLEGLAGDVRRVWPERSWNGKVVAYAVSSPTFVHSWYGRSAAGEPGNGDRASFVAKVATLQSSPSKGDHAAIRMVVTPYLLASPRSGYSDILRHELTHVATAAFSQRVPVWLVEGAAEYTGFARRSGTTLDATRTLGEHGLTSAEVSATARGTWRPTLVEGHGFYAGSEKAVDERYNSAFITCLYIADHYGEARLRLLYEQAHRGGERQILRQVLHTDRAHLIAAAGAYATTLRQRLVFR